MLMEKVYICQKCGKILTTASIYDDKRKESVSYMMCISGDCGFYPIRIEYIEKN